jgi:AraC-like DNA-binding protein
MKIKSNSAKLIFWRAPHLENIDFLHGLNITHDYPRHLHEEYCIELVLRGTETTIYRGASHKAVPGSLLLINPEEVHASKSVRTEYKVIKMRPPAFSRISSEIFGRNTETFYFPKLVIQDPLVFRLLLKLYSNLKQNLSFLEQESELISTIALLIKRQNKDHLTVASPGEERHYIKLIRDYIRSHYAENILLSELSSLTNLSPYYLLRAFHRRVGLPPHEYQTQVRIAHARKLLSGGYPISDTALETGFCDQSHFARNFKRIVGMTPGRYFSESKIVQDLKE